MDTNTHTHGHRGQRWSCLSAGAVPASCSVLAIPRNKTKRSRIGVREGRRRRPLEDFRLDFHSLEII